MNRLCLDRTAWLLAAALLPLTCGASDRPPAMPTAPAAATEAVAPGTATAVAAADDPLEGLRQRLAKGLAGARTREVASSGDVHLVARPAPASAADTGHSTPSAAGAAAAAPSAAANVTQTSAAAVLRPAAATAAGAHGTPPAARVVSTAVKPAHGSSATVVATAPAALTAQPVNAVLNLPDAGHDGAAAASGAGHAHWGYNGAAGPTAWATMKPEYALCGNGQRQSPIDIRGGLAVDLEPVKFDYRASRFAVIDNGHTVQVNLSGGNSIEVGGKHFELLQFHFHRPSEERIDGRQFEMSVHLVHKDEQGRLAVVTILLDKGAAQPVIQKVWNNLPLETNEEMPARQPLELLQLLPADRRYFTYMGSLTTPPCSEGVQWIVLRQPVTVTAEQIEIFARIYPMNARPVQAAAGRRILQSAQ